MKYNDIHTIVNLKSRRCQILLKDLHHRERFINYLVNVISQYASNPIRDKLRNHIL